MALATIRKILKGQHVIVLGSAPLTEEERAVLSSSSSSKIVCVNGSIGAVGNPDLWVLNSRQYDDHVYNDPVRWPDSRKQLHESMMQQGSNAKPRHILFLLKSYKIDQTIARLLNLNVSWRGETLLNTGQKMDLAYKAGVKKFLIAFNVSAGLFAAIVALHCKAAKVTLIGFSFQDGYAYLKDISVGSREHISQDKEALNALLPKYGDRLCIIRPLDLS